MSPLRLHIIFYYYISCIIVEGRTVRGIIGRNVSFSFNLSNSIVDFIEIHHRNSEFAVVWPKINNVISIQYPQRVSIVIDNKTALHTKTVIISILNLTADDSGIYTAKCRFSPMELLDSVSLETNDHTLIPNIEMVLDHSLDSTLVLRCTVSNTSTEKILWRLNGKLIENSYRYFLNDTLLFITNIKTADKNDVFSCMASGRELESNPYSIRVWINHYLTTASFSIDDTTGTYIYTTSIIATYIDVQGTNISSNGVPPERYFLFIILGMGIIFAATFLVFRWKKTTNSGQVTIEEASTQNGDENHGLQEGNTASNYWTILSNAKGEMSTAIETNDGFQRGNLLVVVNEITRKSDYEDSIKSDDIYVSQEIAGYLNPVSTIMRECDDYIHAIQSNSLCTPLSLQTLDSLNYSLNTKMQAGVKSISI